MPTNPAASARCFPARDASGVYSKTIAIAMATRPPTASIVEWSGSWCQRQSGQNECMTEPTSSAPRLNPVKRITSTVASPLVYRLINPLASFRTQVPTKIKDGDI